ncbi:MAG: hypothetical protein PHV33_09920 [Elusimicrobiales bacterium]|nr:hypothetical protein [Elusimicrobiales bacterium]
MNDLAALLPILLALAITAGPIAAGLALRRKFSPARAAEGGQEPLTGGQKTARLIGTILLWCGILAGLLMIVFALNFKGMLL